MKLFYYKDKKGNFGDDLNPWMWPKFLTTPFDEDEREIFVGIGTLLNQKLPKTPIKHVFGSGYGYGDPPVLDDTFVFHAVRGPLTAEKLGVDPKKAITDSAILLRAVDGVMDPVKKRYTVGFVPHHDSNFKFPWAEICEQAGVKFIDVAMSVENFLYELKSCDLVLCEAMHGAIVADALRIPWKAVCCYEHIYPLKWHDWCASVGLKYEPAMVTSLYDEERHLQGKDLAKNKLKRTLQRAGIYKEGWDQPLKGRSSRKAIDEATAQLSALRNADFGMSTDQICVELTDRYLELVAQFNAR